MTISVLDKDGNPQTLDPPTQTTLAAILAKLSSDPATQTTLAAILAKLIAAPATEAKQDAIVTALGALATAANQSTANTTLATLLTAGTPIIGQSLETGGAGALGWFASIRKKIAAFGVAGTPSSDVLTVQGVSGGTTLEVGGNSAVVALSFTVSTTPAYTSGDVIGGKVTIANALRTAGKNALLQDLFLFDNANQKPVGSLLFFNADPSAATTTDNSAFAYSTDTGKQIGRVDIAASDWTTINSKASLHIKNIGAMLSASGTTLYAVFVTTSTPTYTATTDLSGAIGLLRD